MRPQSLTLPADHWLNRPRIVVLVLFLGVVMAVGRLAFQTTVLPLPDEAYYWLWGQRWDWSYYDHPPLQAWLQRLVSDLGINGVLGLRVVPTLGTTAVVLWALSIVLERRGISGRRKLAVLCVFLASPVFYLFTMLVFPDHLMLAFLALALVSALPVLEALDRDAQPNALNIVAVGLWLGLAMLTKYNAALVALALVVLVLWYPRYRVLFRNPWLYAAVSVALLCLFPVFWWNLQQQGASFDYNLNTRLRFVPDRIAGNALGYFLGSVAAVSVFLVPAVVRVLRTGPFDALQRLAVFTFLVPSLVWLAATSVTNVLYYWNIVAYVVIVPLGILYLRSSWAVLAHMGFGVALSLGLLVNYTHAPASAILHQAVDHESALVFGWDRLVPRILDLSNQHGAPRLVASDYRYGGILAWKTGDTTVEVYSNRKSQFDIWQSDAAIPRAAAILLTSNEYPMSPVLSDRFDTITHLENHIVTRRGVVVVTWDIWLGQVN